MDSQGISRPFLPLLEASNYYSLDLVTGCPTPTYSPQNASQAPTENSSVHGAPPHQVGLQYWVSQSLSKLTSQPLPFQKPVTRLGLLMPPICVHLPHACTMIGQPPKERFMLVHHVADASKSGPNGGITIRCCPNFGVGDPLVCLKQDKHANGL